MAARPSSADPLQVYLHAIDANIRRGDATEHTHGPALKALLEALDPDIVATVEPTRVACGAPDLLVERRGAPVGHVETRDIGADLEAAADTPQLSRYRSSLSNLVLTNYRDFHWYVDGELRLRAALSRAASGEAAALLRGFLAARTPSVATTRDLARRLARLCHLLRETLERVLRADRDDGPLHAQLAAFREVLIKDMSAEEFTDMSAQSIVHGLFTARCHSADPAGFTRETAVWALPRTNPFLRQLFNHVAGPDLDERIAWVVDCIASLLAATDIDRVLVGFGKVRVDDPVIHFYETFLAEYDARLREVRGVYYTPKPVVDYIVRSVDHLLRERFDAVEGLADRTTVTVEVAPKTKGKRASVVPTAELPRVLVLDPAVGTGAFLHGVIELVHGHIAANHGQGVWSSHVKEHLLSRIHGFELLMAPYAVAHMKLSMQLARTGYPLVTEERLRVYLTNTLEEAWEHGALPLFAHLLVEEARAAGQVKQQLPIMVVLGNPPYSGHSANRGTWIRDLLADYKKDIPELKKPGQAKWLQDDYVKFIRFAQWRIAQTGHGIVAFITNHAWLSNPTFRGMRRSLLETFDAIWLLDLHGNSKKRERAPDGGKDENVFDIQQGVAISLFVRHQDRRKARKKTVHYADLWGSREHKYEVLAASTVASTAWRPIDPAEPEYLFTPQPPRSLRDEYDAYWSVADIFNQSGDPAPGIVTTHDGFAVSWTADEMREKVERLLATATEAEARRHWTLCSQSQWSYERAKRELAGGAWRDRLVPILYRPFDVRHTVYDRNVAVHRRERVFSHMLAPRRNLALITNRGVEAGPWCHALCTTHVTAHHALSMKEINYVFPLWLFDQDDRLVVEQRANINPEFVRALPGSPTPEQVFAYVYAVLHAPTYRRRYEEFLRAGFPRVPVAVPAAALVALVELGARLVALHTMMAPPALPLPTFPVAGSNRVDKPTWKAGRLHINASQFFEPVSEAAWTLGVGGYTPAARWLVDRKKARRTLSFADIAHVQRLIGVLDETCAIMARIDATIDACGGWPVA